MRALPVAAFSPSNVAAGYTEREGCSMQGPQGFAGRCVRVADYTIDGKPVVEAISSCGERIAQIAIEADVLDEVIREWLWGFLDGIDPVPKLLRSA